MHKSIICSVVVLILFPAGTTRISNLLKLVQTLAMAFLWFIDMFPQLLLLLQHRITKRRGKKRKSGKSPSYLIVPSRTVDLNNVDSAPKSGCTNIKGH